MRLLDGVWFSNWVCYLPSEKQQKEKQFGPAIFIQIDYYILHIKDH